MSIEMRDEEMIYSEFVKALYRNHEIEMKIQGHPYFLSPFMDECEENEYAILDVRTKKVIFNGTIEQLVLYQFDDTKTLKEHFQDFIIEDIF